MMSKTNSNLIKKSPSQFKLPSWFGYGVVGLIGNALVCGGVFYYLKVTPKVYTSEWSITIIEEKNTSPSVSIPGAGQATAPQVPKLNYRGDPRYDYVYLFERPHIIAKTAQRLNLDPKDFNKPKINLPKDSSLILFSIDGGTPEEAQKKSEVFYQVIQEEIEKLRQKQIDRQENKTETELTRARDKFNRAQDQLATYQATALFRSDEQLAGLAGNIESLRMRYIELSAEEQALNRKIQQLAKDVEIPQNNLDTYALQADRVYQEYFNKYGVISGKYTELSSQLGQNHPSVVEAKSELDSTIAVLQDRASFVLKRKVSLEELVNLSTAYLDPQTAIVRGQFFQELVNSRAQQQAFLAQKRELERQITNLEARLKIMVEEQREVNKLQLEVELAKALLTSTSAKVELGTREDIYAFYPPFDLIVPPNLPDLRYPTAPKKKMVYVAGLAGCFLITTGLIFLWWDQQNYQKVSRTYDSIAIFQDME